MKRIEKYIYQNSLSIIVIFISIFIVGLSFYQYFSMYYGYAPKYYEYKRQCEHEKNEESCKTAKLLGNPKEQLNKLDAITLSCEIVQHHAFEYMQLLTPLFIIIITLNKAHGEINSGIFRYYLTRMKYKDYIKRFFKFSLKPAMLLPCLLLLIFFISCLITRFNFKVDSEVLSIAVYDSWKYNNFILYIVILCVVHYFMGIFYGNMGLFFCKKNKSKLISIFLGYIAFFIIDIIFYVGIYALIINKFLGYHNLMKYFNLIGYLSFKGKTNFVIVIMISLLLAILSYFTLFIFYRNKERMILANEKENN